MKNILIYLLPLFLLFSASCLKTQNAASNPSQYPSGSYTGTFYRIHRSLLTNATDTLKANLILTLNPTTGFTITGDTTTVHAGSTGAYAFTATYAQFADITYPKMGVLKKVHLEGTYLYSYDGTNLALEQQNDTLTYLYNFKSN